MATTSGDRQGWWKRLRAELRRAFMLPSRGSLTDAERAWIAAVARKVVDRRLAAPALVLLESIRPVQFVTSQALVFLGPVLKVVVPPAEYDRFVSLMERPGAVDELAAQIEALENQRDKS